MFPPSFFERGQGEGEKCLPGKEEGVDLKSLASLSFLH